LAIRQEATMAVRKYIEIFCNRQRKQARLGYLSPAAYKRRFYQQQTAYEVWCPLLPTDLMIQRVFSV
jgi:hypothetical protein